MLFLKKWVPTLESLGTCELDCYSRRAAFKALLYHEACQVTLSQSHAHHNLPHRIVVRIKTCRTPPWSPWRKDGKAWNKGSFFREPRLTKAPCHVGKPGFSEVHWQSLMLEHVLFMHKGPDYYHIQPKGLNTTYWKRSWLESNCLGFRRSGLLSLTLERQQTKGSRLFSRRQLIN